MSEQQNLEQAKATYDAFRRGDVATVMQGMAEDIEWVIAGNTTISGTFHGKAAVQEWFGKLAQTLDISQFDVRDFIAQGNKVVALIHSESTVRSTGKKLVDELAHVHTYRDGKQDRFQEYSDTAAFAEALRG